MPTPVAALLNSPETTLSFDRYGVIGSRLLLSSISAPEPLAHQFLGLMPLPMNSAPKRLGCAALGSAAAIASSHGSATVTPRPRSRVRRETVGEYGMSGTRLGNQVLVPERNNHIHLPIRFF